IANTGKPAIVAPLLDGGDPAQSTLNSPRGLAFTSAGDLLIADTAAAFAPFPQPYQLGALVSTGARQGTGGIRIMKKGTDGTGAFTSINEFAGAGIYTASTIPINAGDGRGASVALLNNPRGVSVDSAGNVLIADSGNKRVRFVDANSTIIAT